MVKVTTDGRKAALDLRLEQKSRHGSLRFSELRVEGEMRGKMICEPVFTAPDED